MNDRLVEALRHFGLSARVFHAGPLCVRERFVHTPDSGYLHVLRAGALELHTSAAGRRAVTGPSVMFLPRGTAHRLQPAPASAPDLVCAAVAFGAGVRNPLTRAAPEVLVAPLTADTSLDAAVELLFREANEAHCGREAVVDRLSEIVIVLLLRHLMDAGLVHSGILAGLADPRLARAINAMHEAPAEKWTLTGLARVAGMSRARFAAAFRDSVGQTPGSYLADWRIGLAQTRLRAGVPVSVVATEVGYDSASALARAFSRTLGIAPTAWLRQVRSPGGDSVSADTG